MSPMLLSVRFIVSSHTIAIVANIGSTMSWRLGTKRALRNIEDDPTTDILRAGSKPALTTPL